MELPVYLIDNRFCVKDELGRCIPIQFTGFGGGGRRSSPSPPSSGGWLLDGNTNLVLKYIGTNDNFDFPIRVNGIEIGRFLVPTVPGFNNDGRFFINQILPDNGSNAGGQLSALRPNRAQWRMNQYGANNAGGGITTFKSRNLVVGAPLLPADAVLVGDIIQGFTAIGVTDNALIPLAYTQRVVVVQNANGSVAADWELSLCPVRGSTNSGRKVFAISSEGVPRMRESTFTAFNLVVLGAFVLGEMVTAPSGAIGFVGSIINPTTITIVNVLQNPAINFVLTDVITGATSGAITTINGITSNSDPIYPASAGLVILDINGTATIPNLNVKGSSRFNLTIQDGGAVPTQSVYISSRINGASFTISTMNGGEGINEAVEVYWQMFEPQPVVVP